MDGSVVAAIIAACTAVLVASISSAVSFISLNSQKKHESKSSLLTRQASLYQSFIESMQEIMNAGDPNHVMPALQMNATLIYISGDKNVAEAIFNYMSALFSSVQTRQLLTSEDHHNHQLLIINSIRVSQGLDTLDTVSMIAIRAPES